MCYCTYADVGRRARQMANALTRLGLAPGERSGTLVLGVSTVWMLQQHVEAQQFVPATEPCLRRVAKWWLQDDVAFVDELSHTATGKLQKMKVREQLRDHVLSGD